MSNTKELRRAVLRYLGNRVGDNEIRCLDVALQVAAARQKAFDERRDEVIKEIRNGSKRSSGKLPV